MIEVLYRIYEIASEEEKEKNRDRCKGYTTSISQVESNELVMDCCICEDREQFKDIIRDTYGEDIAFRYSKKLREGDVYCIIIGEHCYNKDRYFNKITYECDNCGAKVESYYGKPIKFEDYEINTLYNIDEYSKERFCCYKCKQQRLEYLERTLKPGDEDDNFFIEKGMFKRLGVIGYIYKITKRSTGEFYIGQTSSAPVFRWGQHLKTDRFKIENIEDYIFETIYTVKKGENILEVEKEFIQEYYKKYPDLSLNIQCVAGVEQDIELEDLREILGVKEEH